MKGFGKIISVFSLIFLAAMIKILPHPPNVSPIGAMCLFGGALIGFNLKTIIACFSSLYLSDLLLNNTVLRVFYPDHTGLVLWADYMSWTYLGFAVMILLGSRLSISSKLFKVVGMGVIASIAFFILTNFGTWTTEILYPKTLAGLGLCFQAAIPFYWSSLISTVVFSLILFTAARFIFSRNQKTAVITQKS